jgi:hypothetical protein
MRNLTIIIVVAAVAIAALLMLQFHHATSSAKPAVPTAKATQPRTIHSFKLINQPKMVTVKRQPGMKLAPFSHLNPWSDIQLIMDTQADFHQRLNAIGRLPSKLTDADWRALRNFLLKPDPSDNDQLGQVVKNVLMDKLCQMNPSPSGLNTLFTQMGKDAKQDEVIRDYAYQHLTTFDEELAGQNGKAIAKEEQSDQKALWNALFETGDSIGGTALLGLERLSQSGEQVNSNQLSGMALEMANDPNAGELTLITAYQVCAQRDVQQALPTIESAAQSSETTSAQISAIGALGTMGGANDIPLLQNLLQGNQERLNLPAQTAINRIEQRLQLQASIR